MAKENRGSKLSEFLAIFTKSRPKRLFWAFTVKPVKGTFPTPKGKAGTIFEDTEKSLNKQTLLNLIPLRELGLDPLVQSCYSQVTSLSDLL